MTEPENPLVTKLREELHRRQEKNQKYSLLAFAIYLGMDPSNLSKIFRGERPLSDSCITTLTRKLYGEAAVEETFMTEVIESARAQRRQMNEPFQQTPFPVAEVGEWHHFVLMEVSRVMRINTTTIPWIATSLEVPQAVIIKSLNDLIHWNVVEEKNGEYTFNGKNLLSKTRKKVNKMSETTANRHLFAVYNLTMALYPITKENP